MLLPRRCRGSLCVWSAHMSSMIVVGCNVPHWRRSSKLGGRARSGSAPTLHSFLRGAVTSCVALRSLFVYFSFSVFVVMCGNGARVLCRARSCFVLSLIVHEHATSEDTFKGCKRMRRGAQTRDLWFFIRDVFRVRCGARQQRSCRLLLFLASICVPRVANFEHETQVRSHLC